MNQRDINKINGSRGVVAISTIILIGAITVIGVGALYNSQMNVTIAQNYKKRIQSFYASDGLMTLLAQEVIDGRSSEYVGNEPEEGYIIKATRDRKFVVLDASGRLCPIESDSTRATVFKREQPQTNWQLRVLSPGPFKDKYVKLDDNDVWIAAAGTAGTGCEFHHAPCPWNGDDGISPRAICDESTPYVTSEDYNGQRVLRSNRDGCSTSEGSWERVYFVPFSLALESPPRDTTEIEGVEVTYRLEETVPNCFNLETESYLTNAGGKDPFRTPLKQYLELPAGGFTLYLEDSLLVPVTFYDFHSDRSNPEFEQPHRGGGSRHYHMVADTLDADRKPVPGDSNHLNTYIKYWFRPWKDADAALLGMDGAQGDFTMPIYKGTTMDTSMINPITGQTLQRWKIPAIWEPWGSCHCNELWWNDDTPVIVNVPHDTAFKNVVIQDTLVFILQDSATGTYKYRNNNFFKLDNRGFGNEWNVYHNLPPYHVWADHNYSFTMEMHRKFVKVPGLVFEFHGDDDVWVFINDSLVMDIGGTHTAQHDTLYVDSLPLADFKEYNIDFFYCERHSGNSSIDVRTNMLVGTPVTVSKRSWSRDYGTID